MLREPFNGSAFDGREVILLLRPGIGLNLQAHAANTGDRFDPTVAGLDHLAFRLESMEALHAWGDRLDSLGVAHSPVMPLTSWGSFIEFRDPDDIQLELHFLSVDS